MTKEEIGILCDLYDIKIELAKKISTADDMKYIFNQAGDKEAYKYYQGQKNAYMVAMTILSTQINKIKNGEYDGTNR